MRRGLLLIVIVLVAILAWPAMTPGLFSGEGVRDAWRMAAEAPHALIYRPRFRQIFARPGVPPPEVALQTPIARERFADIRPEIERRIRPLYVQLAAIHVEEDEIWWIEPEAWDFWLLPGPPGRRHHRHHHHHDHDHDHHPHPPVGSVPEPATWLLMISGFALVGSALRVRRAAPSTP